MSKRVLIIDDNWEIRLILQDFLESEGYEVDTAEDGLLAWEKLTHQSANYEAILLDLTMPRMNGLQLIQALREQKETCLSQVIVISANEVDAQQALEMGIHYTLIKPFDLDTVLELISAVRRSKSLAQNTPMRAGQPGHTRPHSPLTFKSWNNEILLSRVNPLAHAAVHEGNSLFASQPVREQAPC